MLNIQSSSDLIETTNESKAHRPRYLLKVKTLATCVEITAEMLLLVGTDKGQILAFDLSALDATDS
jgi:hypothetical protein